MMAVWPPELDPPLRASWQAQAGDGRRRTATEAGPMRVSRRFSRTARPVSMTLDLSRAEKARFDRFFYEVRQGTLPFLMTDPTTTDWNLLTDDDTTILTDDGRNILLEETWVCLFGDALPAETVYGVRFRISFDIAVMP